MNPPPPQKQHEVVLWGRRLYRVSSASRKKVWHWCDLERDIIPFPVCDCESFRLRKERPYCRHLAAVFWFIAQCAPTPEKQRSVYEMLLDAIPAHPLPESESSLLAKIFVVDKPNRCVTSDANQQQPRKYQLHKAA